MPIQSLYEGKRILITGTTGFLGKVLLEKFLFSLSSVDKIYVLIRNKEGSNLYQRFKKEVISSLCFDRIRNVHKNKFVEFIKNKIHPIQGDLLKDGLGLSKQSQTQLIENCHMIINCAASIDFNARLDYAINININGPLRIMQLAKKMKKLECYTHISTCYVNSDKKGLIKEQIYEREPSAEEQFKNLTSHTAQELITNTTKLLGQFPNTYTYTKCLCERLIQQRKKDMPICIVRPAIINTSMYEPFPGWIDSLAAATALYLLIGLGIVRQLKANGNLILDTVPVDIVVATIIVACAYNIHNKKLVIYHVGSSDRNPLTTKEIKNTILDYWNTNKLDSQISRPEVFLTTSDLHFRYRRLKRTLPVEIYKRLGPLLGKQHVKNAEKMVKTLKRVQDIGKIFHFFVTNEWIYECRNFKKIWQFLTPEQRVEYLIDPAEIDAIKFIHINNYGIQKYILKENAEKPESSNLLKIHKANEYFGDIKWMMNNEIITTKIKVINELKTKILSSSRVMKAIQAEVKKLTENKKISQESANFTIKGEAQKIINSLVGEVKVPVLRSMAWTLHKLFKNLYEKIIISMEMLQSIRQIEKNSGLPIILLPTHRSYFDFLIVSYIFFVYKLRLPCYVQDEAFLQSEILSFVAKSCGAFFFEKQKYEQSLLYRIIFDKYIELLLREGNTIQFFIEGTRSRTGKILAPQFQILNVVLDTIIYGKVPEVCIIPITINYQKVFEGNTFPNELLGEQKVAESLIRVLKATPNMRHNHGRVYVQICKPIMGRKFITELKLNKQNDKLQGPEERKFLLKKIVGQIIKSMTEGIVIMNTAMVSSVLLMHRKGISQDSLIKLVNELAKYIVNKGFKIGGINEYSSAVAVRNAIGHLSGIIMKTKKNIFELTISAGDQFQKILMLSYYRNTLIHAFLPEAFIGCAMASFGEQLSFKQGILRSRVYEKVVFLIELFRQEYFIEYSDFNLSNFNKLIQRLTQNSIIEIRQEKVIISPSGISMIAFFCSLIKPQIQCYWASLVYIITIARSHEKKHQTSSLAKFYDTVQWFMQSLYDEKVIEDYEACSLELIKNAFQKYEKEKLITIVNGVRMKEGSSVTVQVEMDTLQGLQNNIKFFRKSVQSSIMSPMKLAKSSMKQVMGLSKI